MSTLNPTTGDEIAKARPCIVLSNRRVGRLALRLVVPLTDWKEPYVEFPWMVRIEPDAQNGLSKISAADAFQVRSASLQRFTEHLGELSQERMERVFQAVTLCIRE